MQERAYIESRQEMEELLHDEATGYLGLAAEGGPYVVPLNYAYVEGRILFHCALTGKKMDYLRANSGVCFTVGRQSGGLRRHGAGDPCHVDSDSVICYGTARAIEDPAERKAVLDEFNRCFNAEAEEISLESAKKCGAVEIRISEMTGRREREGDRTYWRYRFER
jgi:nitroimidazol reductase NimA-like FMN-containing flavoprotein (pyridoxamine 5'-phosphate oxidase superfamily)